ncbi:phosphotransferase [Nocardioides sp. GY 10127]|uniref:phosphotransferase family protein n=1 Tax=Nocardioides sp. GY 10127 TaxID=2569762 RepID=UPI0010A85283|nr:phosphotransferase [Nocardioides sp. GY 10127]TIC82585.1 aminoglycoside phosphotransferase family protein [Nocardioides sp. GY 10127]
MSAPSPASPVGELLAHGRSAVVHAYVGAPPDAPADGADGAEGVGATAGAHVVKVIEGLSAAEVDQEERNTVLAHRLGLTPIGCHGRVDVAGRPGLVLDRLTGVCLTTLAERNILRLREVSRVLADEHARLHAVPVSGFVDVRELAVAQLAAPGLAGLTPAEREEAARLLRALPAGDRPLHLDFHPQNVFVHGDGYAVVDWQTACQGAPAADVAMTKVLFTEAELFPGTAFLKLVLYASVRRVMFGFYLRRYRAVTGMTDAEIDSWLLAARVLRAGLLHVPSEQERLLRGIRRDLEASR